MSSYLETRAYALPHKAATVPILPSSSGRNRRIDAIKTVKMKNLTIRNLTITPLELKEVERYEDSTKARKPNGLAKITARITGKSSKSSLASPTAAATTDLDGTAQEPGTAGKQDITDVHIQPFSEHQTSIPLPDASKGESLRLTFSEPNKPYTYSVSIPGPSPRSIVMKANLPPGLQDQQQVPPPDREFTLIYMPHHSFLAIFSSTHLNRWMAELDPSYPLSALSIPGTHNSPTCYVALPSVRCQAVPIREQLDNGVRFLDVRVSCPSPSSRSPSPIKTASPRLDTPDSLPGAFPISPTSTRTETPTDINSPAPQPELSPQAPEPTCKDKEKAKAPNLSLVHSAFPVALSGTRYFHDLLSECYAFLDANPSETVLMSIKREGTGRGTDQHLSTYLAAHYLTPDRWYSKPEIPTLEQARGRIVLVRRFHLDPSLQAEGMGIDGSVWPDNCADGMCGSGRIRIQDYYEVGQTQHIKKKIGFAKEGLMRAAQQVYGPSGIPDSEAAGGPMPLFINFLSGSNFFNASCWPEKIAAKINPHMIEYLCMDHGAPQKQPSELTVGDAGTGIVVTDWVGNNGDWDLIRCIVGWNARLQLTR
ncbi:PLC-like phosphodiesterase [Neurospora crassa]|uniref:Phosphatidylinositol phospholipase C n=1 Tax=Neurospora crassa (strain ATCC 24698 / 74-OR23-1A / CBS 708.71 / DSM 1257 / FGSC 987) TaxID=367110 RepID=V5IR48_NEUCR|nr:phosphatidylinositol phospholipase C, variant [Neurospora crassa OR74A]XP_011393248.1 phosphatidylinositol phospholipase C [Neurospora crassa OR74A]ESA44124.1 phosphatidylinositol phospholipase C [Neurospora crassa OR74A]ESA44125.1 phosphatidylinositol phospholipase C, variant [Neurospora crassa OR74A]KHE80611.1 PLC-like phosphodiesterase [Neurospora crassa]|eukprot:XP_011393247.1 phosphatidylinositol phospholipase C, variant [Neurospora crassa OR74A]